MIERSKRRHAGRRARGVRRRGPRELAADAVSLRRDVPARAAAGRLADRLPAAAAEGPDRRRRRDRRRARLPARHATRSTALLRPGMKLTIAFDDICLPLPPMKHARHPPARHRARARARLPRRRRRHPPDRRARAAPPDDAGRAQARRRRRASSTSSTRTASTTTTPRIPTGSSTSARRAHGEAVELSKRAAESDLLVYVNINLVTMDGGHKSVAVGLGTYSSAQGAPQRRTRCGTARSFMDPAKSELHHSAEPPGRGRRGRASRSSTSRRRSTTTCSTGRCAFLAKPEARWTPREQATFARAEAHDRPDAPEAAPRRVPQAHRALRGDRRHRRRGRPGARGHARALRRPAGRPASAARPTSSPPGCPTSARTTSTRS